MHLKEKIATIIQGQRTTDSPGETPEIPQDPCQH